MANRRMFSKTVVLSAKFVKLPNEARLLYYNLGVNADDDGVVEALIVLRQSNIKSKWLQVLEDCGFIKILNNDLVTYITDWKKNNNIRKDRYTPSIYQELVNSYFPNELESKKSEKDKSVSLKLDLDIQIKESEEI